MQVVNVRNDGTLPFLPTTRSSRSRHGSAAARCTPLPVEPLEPLYAGLVAAVTAYEHLALEAALHGGRHRVFDGAARAPAGRPGRPRASGLTDRLLAHNRDYLPWAR